CAKTVLCCQKYGQLAHIPKVKRDLRYIDGAWQTLDVGARFTQEQINNKQILFLLPSSAADGATADGFVFSVHDSSLSPWPDAGQEGAIRDDAGVIATDLRFSITINRDDDGSGGGDPGDEDGVIPPPPPPVDGGGSGGDGGGNGGDGGGNGGGNGGDNGGNEGGDNGGGNNEPLQEGGTVSIGSDVLQTDPGSGAGDRVIPPDEIVYTVTSLPPNGELQQLVDGNWEPIKFYGQFTQADIDAGNIRFEHDGGEDHDSSFSYSVSVGGENRVEGTVSLSAKPVNDITGATGGSLIVVEKTDSTDGIAAITPEHIGMRDPDGSLDNVAGDDGEGNEDTLWFQVTDLPDNGSLQYWDGDSWEAVQSDQWFSQEILLTPADGNDSGLRYVHEGGDQPSNLSDGFSFKVRDDLAAPGSPFDVQTNLSEPAADNVSNTAVVAIAIAAFNDAPLVPGASGDAPVQGKDQSGNDVTAVNNGLTVDNGNAVNEGGMAVISGDDLRAIDSDNNAIQRQYLITDNVDNGTLYLNGKALGVGSTFTQADIDSGRLTYQHDGSENHSDSFSFIVSDGVAETPVSSFAIDITPANDTAGIQAPDRVDGSGNSTIDLGNGTITVVDSDLAEISAGEEDQLTIILELTEKGSDTLYDEGYFALGAGFSSLVVGGSDQSSTITLRGTQAEIQAALDSLQLVLEDTGDGADKDTVLELKVSVDDRIYDVQGDLVDPQSANGGSFNESGESINQNNNVVNKTIEILLSTINDPPTLMLPSDITVREDKNYAFNGSISISDVDAFDKTIKVTLSVDTGKLILSDKKLITEGKNGGKTITLEGSQADINAALSGLKYKGARDFNGSAILTVTVNDMGNSGTGGSAEISDTVNITVTPFNDAPTLIVPGTQVLDEGTTIVFSKDNNNQIKVDDPGVCQHSCRPNSSRFLKLIS
ncbi:cadherin-like domain-containing protein, partial [Kistimonas scapharcae]|uniref:cadherin-like domain-containing protein n=1 Tax=Kistimonas scapharcae TaxID=1036133 RepID=UPI0031ED6054